MKIDKNSNNYKQGYRDGYDWADKCAHEPKLGFSAIITKDGHLITSDDGKVLDHLFKKK